ncbi:MAG TPA: hypothetical protein VII78_10860 [Myxococcota bacterium]
MSEKRSATGSCARCRAELDLASVRVGDAWYCRAACAEGETARRPAAIAAEALINRPRRHFARRDAKELRRA